MHTILRVMQGMTHLNLGAALALGAWVATRPAEPGLALAAADRRPVPVMSPAVARAGASAPTETATAPVREAAPTADLHAVPAPVPVGKNARPGTYRADASLRLLAH